ncbi:UNVERIFIED_CONTAM: hypothetical protein Cloal_3159 [Acetivibrio alkalicellulosi]
MKKSICIVSLIAIMTIFIVGCQKENAEQNKSTIPSQSTTSIESEVPMFIDVKDALAILKQRPVGTDPWKIYYAGCDYIFATYNFGVELIFRYNIKENTIDQALDVSCLHKDIKEPSSTNFFFTTDGLVAFFVVGKSINYKSEVSQNWYKAEFEKKSIELVTKKDEDFKLPSDMEYYKQEKYGTAAQKYLEKSKENPSLPKVPDWSTVAQIDNDTFCIIMLNDTKNGSPGAGYYYFKFIVVNVAQNKILQEYRIDSAE